jgi:cytochrome oxidase assembly protein ShyY1
MKETGVFAALTAIFIILAVLGWMVRRIQNDTDFMADVMEQTAQRFAAAQQVAEPDEDDDYSTNPIGFTVKLKGD